MKDTMFNINMNINKSDDLYVNDLIRVSTFIACSSFHHIYKMHVSPSCAPFYPITMEGVLPGKGCILDGALEALCPGLTSCEESNYFLRS